MENIKRSWTGLWACTRYDLPAAEFDAACAEAGRRNSVEAAERAVQEAEAAWLSAETSKVWASLPHVFVRFGRPPAGEKSKNHATGTPEDGVSCYEAAVLPDGGYWIWEICLKTMFMQSFLADRPAYILAGERVGTGGDNEPVVKIKGRPRRVPEGTGIVLPMVGRVEAK